MGANIVVKWENIVSSLDSCERPEDLVHILLFPAFSYRAESLDLLAEFFCKRAKNRFALKLCKCV